MESPSIVLPSAPCPTCLHCVLIPPLNEFLKTYGRLNGGNQCIAELTQLLGEMIASMAISAPLIDQRAALNAGINLAVGKLVEWATASFDNQRQWAREART
jgi:hypothetical protein